MKKRLNKDDASKKLSLNDSGQYNCKKRANGFSG